MTVLIWTSLLSLQAGLLATYLLISEVRLSLFHLYPFVWINLSIWVFWNVDRPTAASRQRLLAAGVAVGYFAILGFFGGLYSWLPLLDHPDHHIHHFEQMSGFSFTFDVPPGYGPALFYTSGTLNLSILPYMLLGYVALSYLIYVTVIDAADAATPGILGLFACVSCTWPILVSIFVGTGTSTTLVAGIYAQAYQLSTIAFVLTVVLLYWRPFHR